MDDEEEKTEKNPSNQRPISYSTEFRLDIINLNNFVIKLCPAIAHFIKPYRDLVTDIHTYIHTDRQTDIQTL